MLNKNDEKQLQRAGAHGRGAVLRAMAIIYRCGSVKTQREIMTRIEDADCVSEFEMVNGALLHVSEITR